MSAPDEKDRAIAVDAALQYAERVGQYESSGCSPNELRIIALADEVLRLRRLRADEVNVVRKTVR